MGNYKKSEVMSALKSKNGIAKITFRKKDGSIREMYASLHQKNIPATKGAKRTKPDNLLTVMDMEKNEWRSFYLDDVLDVKKDVRRFFGVRIGEAVAHFNKRSEADKARKMVRNLVDHLHQNSVSINI